MNLVPSHSRLLFNPLFRALWIGMIASNLSGWLYAGGALTAPRLSAVVNTSTSLSICLLLLLSMVVSLYMQRHGHHQFAFKKMGSGTFAISILTFLGLIGPWVALCAAIILGLCAAIAMLSLQPLLLSRGIVFGVMNVNLARTAGNLASGAVATVVGPAAIFVLSAVSLCAIYVADKAGTFPRPGTALPAVA